MQISHFTAGKGGVFSHFTAGLWYVFSHFTRLVYERMWGYGDNGVGIRAIQKRIIR